MTTKNIQRTKQTSFYLHSDKNRRLYPSTKYRLTHLLDRQSIERRLLKQPVYIKYFKYTCLLLLSFTLISTLFFQIHILLYNSFFGPFHLNLEEFITHIKNFENGPSWFNRIEYIQIELGKNNIQNSINTYDTLRKYSDPSTRRYHIATYKKVKIPTIYVKLPIQSRKYFHTYFPFDFLSYSVGTLQCIVENLEQNSKTKYKTWIEKSDYVKYINEEYKKNSTLFNMLVLTKCGILIGYLYRPIYEKAFTLSKEHKFYPNDIAFDMTRQYFSFYSLFICVFIFICLLLISIFYLFIYLSNIIRFKLFHRLGILSFSLKLLPDVIDELWLLNIDDLPYKELLQLDEFIQKTKYKFNDQLFIIKNNSEQLFVILFTINLTEEINFQDESSPFIICPVNDIRKIVQYGGICYGQDLSWIPWPQTMTDEQNHSEWLHENLMEISEDYRQQYEHRLRYGDERRNQSGLNFFNSDLHSNNDNSQGIRHRRRGRRQISAQETAYEKELKQLIREEENYQCLKQERQYFLERLFEQTNPASPQFIARFRLEQKQNKNCIDLTMQQEQIKCMICLEEFHLNQSYTRWPCPSKTPHIYHFECMLNTLRSKNTCPICRHPVEAGQIPDDIVF